MLQFSSKRHRQLMTASERALHDATESPEERESRIATTIIDDNKKYSEWELRHAKLLVPVAEHRAKKHQILEIRRADMQLVHRKALFRYLQTHDVRGERRKQLFRLFHSTLDFDEAVLTEHRQYMIAFSSGISTEHIVDVMLDNTTPYLVERYENLFGRYFEMKCFLAHARESSTTKLVRTSLRDAQGQLLRLKRQMETSLPTEASGSFERLELLNRSARLEPRNYLNN